MPFFYEQSHYQGIVHLLTAGDIAARVISNTRMSGVAVSLEDGTEVVWGNSGPEWAYTAVAPTEVIGDEVLGGEVVTGKAQMPSGATAEQVAHLIATWPYESAPVPTT